MLNPLEKMNIVLAANQSYSEYILTTIKSIYLHNKHIRFYLLNRDYPTEWFDILNNKLRKLNSEIIDIKVTNDTIKNFKTYSHISSDTTFFRYFISDFIEQDKVIYLDADIVVNGSLTELYQTDISNYFLAAVKDIISEKIYVNNHIFNAGMLLINNKKWREHNITQSVSYTHLSKTNG
nr:glycosyltransferase family 8 protein [[Haemophilus] ducreyi]